MLRPAFPSLLLCVLASLSAAPRAWGAESRLEVPAGGASLALLSWGGRPVVEAETPDGRVLRLLVDTGAGAVLMLGPEAGEVDELRLGAARLLELSPERIAFPLGGARAAERVDGILGIQAFHAAVLVFDFGAERLELARPSALEGGDFAQRSSAFRRDGGMGGIPIVALTVGAQALEAHLDTGAPGLLTVPSELLARLPTRGEARVVGHARTPMGEAEIRELALEGSLRLGELTRELSSVRVADLPQIAGKGIGNVGSALFAGQRLTLDLAHDRLRVERSPPRAAAQAVPAPGGADPARELLERLEGDYALELELPGPGADGPRILRGEASWSRAAGHWRRESFTLREAAGSSVQGLSFVSAATDEGTLELVQLDGAHAGALHLRGGWDAREGALVLDDALAEGAAELDAVERCVLRASAQGGFVKELSRRRADGGLELVARFRYTPRR